MKLYEAKDLIQDVFEHAFDKDRFTRLVKNLLKDIEEKTFTYQGNIIPNAFENYIRKMERIGKFEDEEGNSIDILVVELLREHSIEYARSAQRNFVRWYLSGSRGGQMKDAALVAFHSEKSSDWRFSLIKMQYSLETKKDEFTPAKRFSFLVGEKGKSHTAQRQLVNLLKSDDIPLLNDLEQAFNIESVTNEFFEKYKMLVFNLEESLNHILVNNTSVKREFETKKIDTLDFSKKLMGQIVFLYFLQRKGWLGVQKGQEYGDGDRNFLRNLYNLKNPKENFFNDYLEHLFYDALNNKKRPTDFYPRFNCKIPFLNGGLFDPIGFYDWENTTINLLDDIFTNDIKTKEGDTGTGILDIFDLYNFTVNEAEPLEKEVAVDPEMLGKVFERMLDVKERKSKGVFYTPREIVHYMSQESLIHYLDTALNDDVRATGRSPQQVPKEDIEILIKHGEQLIDKDTAIVEERLKESANKYQIPESVRKHARLIDDKLRDIRVCDPAVGSGAFPVGVMTEIVKARQILTPFIDGISGGANVGATGRSPLRTTYAFKSHCIHHNLYGVDIDASAVEICKLRLWLSLVVDEQRIDIIEPLPNLDYKIVRGNTLINMPDGVMRDQQLEKEIEQLMEKYYAETDKQAKRELKDEIDGKIKQLLKSAEQFTNYPIDFDFKLFFHEVYKEKRGFDVVIANPPYITIGGKQDTFSSDKHLYAFKDLYKSYEYKTNYYSLFIENSIKILKQDGCLTFITPRTLLDNHYFRNLRKIILDNTFLLFLIELKYKVFTQAEVGGNLIIITTKNANKKNSRKNRINAIVVNNEFNINEFNFNLIEQENYLLTDNFRFYLNDDNIESIIRKIESNHLKLKDVAIIKNGVNTGNAANILLSNSKDTSFHRKILEGKNINRYCLKWNGLWINYDSSLKTKLSYKDLSTRQKRVDFSLRNSSLFDSEKLIIRQTSDRLICTYDNEKFITRHSTHLIISISDNVLIKYLLTILNSKLLNYYYQILIPEKGKTFAEVKIINIEKLPIPEISKELQQIFSLIADYIFSLSKECNIKDKIKYNFFDQLIDGMVFELYFEDEVKKAGRDILKHLNNLTPINDNMSDEQKMQVITKTFNELYDKNHPVRQNLYYMDTIEEIRIIKGLDQDAH